LGYNTSVNIQHIKKRIESGEHYFSAEALDAIWWDGYEHGSIDSTYLAFDQGYASAVADYGLYRGEEEGRGEALEEQ
jgi:hypothetical protein